MQCLFNLLLNGEVLCGVLWLVEPMSVSRAEESVEVVMWQERLGLGVGTH